MAALRIAGYIAFFFFAFLLGMYYTFPFDAAKNRLLFEASKQSKMTITARSLEPNWFTGAVLKGVKIRRPDLDEPIELSQVRARAHVLQLLTGGQGVTLDVPVAKGQVHADVVKTAEGIDVVASVREVEVALVPGLKAMTGVPLAGALDIDIDMLAAKDPTKSEGMIKIRGSGLETLKGGTVSGFPIPELTVGNLDWTIPVAKGKATLERLEITGGAADIKLDGEITLGKQLDRSLLNIKSGFKPSPALFKKLPMLEGLLKIPRMKRAKGSDGFYGYGITGTIQSPSFNPQRR